jgi:hypothetical protein
MSRGAGPQSKPVAGRAAIDTLAGTLETDDRRMRSSRARRIAHPTTLLPAALALLFFGSGCRDPQLSEADADDAVVKAVTAYGVTLDASAAPEAVAYVLLRAIRDDVLASQRGDSVARRAAEAVERSIAAPQRIQQGVRQYTKDQMSAAEAVHSATRFWSPIAAHYVGDLDFTLDDARSRMVMISQSSDAGAVHIDVENPQDHRRTTLAISLARENGYWRVYKVGYSLLSVARMRAGRAHATPVTSQPASAPASSPAGDAD